MKGKRRERATKDTTTQVVLKTQEDIDISSFSQNLESKLNRGLKLTEIPFPTNNPAIFKLILYIFTKDYRNKNDLLLLKYYLSSIPSFLNTLNQYKTLNDSDLLLHRIATFIKCEETQVNSIICVNGELGDKYYIVFQGTVAVLIPKKYKTELIEEEYYAHLKNLIELKEYDIFNRTIECNRHVFLSKELLLMKEAMDDTEHLKELTGVSVNDYINRLLPAPMRPFYYQMTIKAYPSATPTEGAVATSLVNQSPPEKINFILWGYHQVCELTEGSAFGDVALSGEDKRRTATIISITPCYMGTISKGVYETSMKETQDKIRKINIEKIHSHQLFKGYSIETFIRIFYNYFKLQHFQRGEIIFSQHEQRNDIFFIKEGDVQISTMGTFDSLENIARSLGGKECDLLEKKRIREMKMTSSTFSKYYDNQKKFNLLIVKGGDSIGMDDHIYNKSFYSTARVISQKCDIFAIEQEFFNIILRQARILQNYNELIAQRKLFMLNRLNDIRNVSIKTFYGTIKTKEEDIEETKVFKMPKLIIRRISKKIGRLNLKGIEKNKERDKEKEKVIDFERLKIPQSERFTSRRSRNINNNNVNTSSRSKTKIPFKINSIEVSNGSTKDSKSIYNEFVYLTHVFSPTHQMYQLLTKQSQDKRFIDSYLNRSRNHHGQIDCLAYDRILERDNEKYRSGTTENFLIRKPKLGQIKHKKKRQPLDISNLPI